LFAVVTSALNWWHLFPGHSSDPDELFMLSLVPELKKVSSEEKFECKCELMQVLAKRLQGSRSNEGTRDSVG